MRSLAALALSLTLCFIAGAQTSPAPQPAPKKIPSPGTSLTDADRAERETVEASGARVIPPEELESWIRRIEVRQGAQVGALRRANAGKWRK